MHQEVELIVSAIEGLKQEPNFFKDYLFPIASAFFTSVLGFFIAYFIMNRQENFQIEKDKLNASNKWTLDVERARQSLFAIKSKYNKRLGVEPFNRLITIPSILITAKPIVEQYQDLSFLIPFEKSKKTPPLKWSQISRINSMVSNYNLLLDMWEKRNELNDQFNTSISKKHDNESFANLNQKEAENTFTRASLAVLIDMNERCIKFTDQIIVELHDFLEHFSTTAKTKINIKLLKKTGGLISYANDGNKKILELLKSEPLVDFSSVAELFGQPSEVMEERHKTGYE